MTDEAKAVEVNTKNGWSVLHYSPPLSDRSQWHELLKIDWGQPLGRVDLPVFEAPDVDEWEHYPGCQAALAGVEPPHCPDCGREEAIDCGDEYLGLCASCASKVLAERVAAEERDRLRVQGRYPIARKVPVVGDFTLFYAIDDDGAEIQVDAEGRPVGERDIKVGVEDCPHDVAVDTLVVWRDYANLRSIEVESDRTHKVRNDFEKTERRQAVDRFVETRRRMGYHTTPIEVQEGHTPRTGQGELALHLVANLTLGRAGAPTLVVHDRPPRGPPHDPRRAGRGRRRARRARAGAQDGPVAQGPPRGAAVVRQLAGVGPDRQRRAEPAGQGHAAPDPAHRAGAAGDRHAGRAVLDDGGGVRAVRGAAALEVQRREAAGAGGRAVKFKRRKSKRRVRCTLCTPHRWQGNSKDRFDTKTRRNRDRACTRYEP